MTGRDTLAAKEIRGMRIADKVIRLYQWRESSENWADWTQKHPKEAAFLDAARRIWQANNAPDV